MYPSKPSTIALRLVPRLVPRLALVAALAAGSLLACGGEEEGAPVGSPGFTACGSFPDFNPKTCQPGQYCADEGLSTCSNGCLSNVNCAADQSCVKAGNDDVGACQGTGPAPDSGPPPVGDQLARCKAACQTMQTCGLLGIAETTSCLGDCTTLSDTQRKVIADCVEPWSCSGGIPACLTSSGIECGGKFGCSGGMQCVGNMCI